MDPSAIVKPCQEKNYQEQQSYYRFDANEITHFSPEMLNASYWQQQNAITGSAQGRGTTWFIQTQQTQNLSKHWVLRHYYRGGLVGKLVKDQYLYTGLEQTRAAKEFALLAKMQTLHLPAPKPIAFKVTRAGAFYRADLLSSRIEQAEDLVAILCKRALTEQQWQAIGQVIKRFHQHNIYHHDLNAHNILIDQNDKIWLIDFDRGQQRSHNNHWPEKNMARLLRSFEKEANKLPNFHWQTENWQTLISGYKA